jgi:hypothetical protein
MTMRERPHGDRPATPASPAPGGSGLLARAAEMQARGADAIDRALSGDSRAYLSANEQEGGQ